MNDTFNVDNITEGIQNVTQQIKTKRSDLDKKNSYLSALKKHVDDISAIDTDTLIAEKKSLQEQKDILIKPVNKYKLYNNIACSGTLTLVPQFTQDEYVTIANFYMNKKINPDVINIYCKYNNIDSDKYIKLYNNYKQSEKIKYFIHNNNLQQLANFINVSYNPILEKEIQKYTDSKY